MIRTLSQRGRQQGFRFGIANRLTRTCEVCKDVVAPVQTAIRRTGSAWLCMVCAVRLGVVVVEYMAPRSGGAEE